MRRSIASSGLLVYGACTPGSVASDLLLGDHLCEKSVTIKWVDVSQPHNRKRRLMNHSRLVEMRESNPNSTAIENNSILRDRTT